MKKNGLIDKLNQHPDREVFVWNGFVGDVMPIGEVIELEMFRMSLPYLLQCIRNEQAVRVKDGKYELPADEVAEITRDYKRGNWGWELNDYITQDDVQSGRYLMKKVIVIEPKKTGKKFFDRAGEVSY